MVTRLSKEPVKLSKPIKPTKLIKPQKPRPPRAKVQFKMPRGPRFVGSWHRIPVTLPPRLRWDDVRFSIAEGIKGGLISPSRDRTWNPKRPHLMLLVGAHPGRFTLEARQATTGLLLGSASFEVNALWRDDNAGPSFWFTGDTAPPYAAGAAWGGGPAGPQNVNVMPATGTRRIAIILVDSTDQRYTTDAATLQGHRDRWINEVFNGAVDGGVTRSVRLLFQEMSLNRFDISAQVFGPFNLPGAFSNYLNDDGAPLGGYDQAAITAADGAVDFTQFDTVAMVMQQVDGPPVRRAWPYAWGGTYTTAEGNRSLAIISMPNEWGVAGDREIYDTFSHELGHNLGLGDQYSPTVAGRNPGSWELMHWDDPLPHLSVAHKAMLGWVDAAWIRSFDFRALAGNVDTNVTLHAIEAGAPPMGRSSAVEVRIADGWNYYFEFRRGQAAQIGDRALPEDGVVLGTDVISPPYIAPFARPAILLLPPDSTPHGEALSAGEDYRETDYTDPTFPSDFRVDVQAIHADRAELRIRYGVIGKPDPSIRPWPASPDRPWQSPDIEVRNARNAMDASWFNVPWVGNNNQVVAKVRNGGQLDAPQVRVNFYVKNYNVGGTPEAFIGTDVRDVAANTTVEFTANWVPPSDGHYCVVVRIPLYQTPATPPATPVVELTEFNNVAQSNYDRFISATSTPSREWTEIEVGNPYPVRARVFLRPGHTNPAYRTYLAHRWLMLDPGETRKVAMMFEFAPDNLNNGSIAKERIGLVKEALRRPNEVGCVAWIEDPFDSPRHKVDMLGGVQMQVVTGKTVRFDRFVAGDGRAAGAVSEAETGKPAKGQVVVRLNRGTAAKPDWDYVPGKLRQGQFVVKIPTEGVRAVDAYFLPQAGLADVWSEVVKLAQRKR